MRLPLARDCGELLMFDEVRRRLHLGMPQFESQGTIRVTDVIGTVGRAGDFDACFQPRAQHLAARIRQIRKSRPEAVNEPIEVLRMDRAYFVSDGHKRLSIAHATGMEFIDARISSVPILYELAPGVAQEAIDLTAHEQRFRAETGLRAAVPGVRFAVTEVHGYAELKEAIGSYGFELMQRLGRVLGREETAALWYEAVYRPTIAAAQRHQIPALMQCITEADLFLSLHRQSQQLWGTECAVHSEDVDHLVTKVLEQANLDESVIGQLVRRARRRKAPELLAERPEARPEASPG
jgi:hypothetical protein